VVSGETRRPSLRLNRPSAWALCVAVTVAAFAITLRDGFGSDDFAWLGWARQAHLPDVLRIFDVWHVGHEMPIIYVAFAVQHALFGLDPAGYRVVSIALHALNVVLVYELGRCLLRSPRAALLAALLFAVHPAHSQAVMWDAAVHHVVATLFYLAALLLFLRTLETGSAGAYAMSLGAAALSLLSKEEGASLPLVCLLAERLLCAGPWTARRLLKYAPFAVLVSGYAVVRLRASQASHLTRRGHYALGWHIPAQLWAYWSALAFPLPAQLVERAARVAWWFPAVRGVAAGVPRAALCAGARLARRRDAATPDRAPDPGPARRLVFVLAWLLVSLLAFLPFTWDIQSRYAYLAAIPFSLLVALAAQGAWRRVSSPWRVLAPALALLAVYGVFTVYNERSTYATGVLSAQLMTELTRRTASIPPGTTIVLVDSPLSAQSARPIVRLSHGVSLRDVRVVNVTTGSAEYEAALADPAALVFAYERGAFVAR
jgi:hypothetical protein